jgi:DHA2 family multidrug resistance protein
MIDTQSQIIGYIDDYKLMLITCIPAVACLLIMRKPKQSSGAPALAHHAVME